MLTKKDSSQMNYELVLLDELVKENHLLRKINKHIDFDFIYDLVEDKYCTNNGRPSVDPAILFKMSLLQALYGIRSERQLVEEIHHNMAYRWFLGFGIKDKIPCHSIFSMNRKRRFKNTDIYDQIFNKIVEQAIEHNLIEGKIFYTDSTHIKANASLSKFENHEVVKTEIEDKNLLNRVNNKRQSNGKKPLKKKEEKEKIKNKKVSKTDPESAFMTRDRKPRGFFYLNHVTVDSKHNIIIDAYVTPGNVHDSTPYVQRLKSIDQRYGLKPKYAGADTGYFTSKVAKQLEDIDIIGVIGPKRHPSKDKRYSKAWFQYVGEWDVYMCPELSPLTYKTTSREGYSEYISDKEHCDTCKRKERCLYSGQGKRTIRRHIDEDSLDKIRRFIKTEKGKRYYARRKETVERVFADAKEIHGLRYARYRGKSLVQMQCSLTATAQNIKKIAMVLSKLSSAKNIQASVKKIYYDIFTILKLKPLTHIKLAVC